MAKERYSRDYRLKETFDEKGHVRVDYEYIGDEYRFVSPEEQIRKEKRLALILCAAGWAAYLAALLLPSNAMHRLYIALPFVFLGVPLFMYVDFTMAFLRMKEPLEHRHADRLNNRYPFIAFLLTVFSLIPAAAEGIFILIGPDRSAGDFVFETGAAVLLFAGAHMFRRKERLAAEISTGKSKNKSGDNKTDPE